MTTSLKGSSTVWVKQDGVQGGIGDVVVTYLDYRTSDHELAVGTHGRGAFVGIYPTSTAISNNPKVPHILDLLKTIRIRLTRPQISRIPFQQLPVSPLRFTMSQDEK